MSHVCNVQLFIPKKKQKHTTQEQCMLFWDISVHWDWDPVGRNMLPQTRRPH